MCFTLCLSLISSSGANVNRWVQMVLNRNVCPPILKKSAEIQNLFFPLPFFILANIIVPLEFTPLRRSCI